MVCNEPGECQGTIVGNSFLSNEEDCQKECFNNANCLWYTFDSNQEFCLLTSNCNPMNSSTPKVYGQKDCYQENTGMNPSMIKFLIWNNTCIKAL